jgi:subtilisin family serine protease
VIRHHPRKTRAGASRRQALLAASITCALLAVCAPTTWAGTPNDPGFALQWGYSNTGQLVQSEPGTPGADERAGEGWDMTTGSRSIVIGETDTGVDYDHPDLLDNVWSNPGAIGGCPAGTHGYNVLTKGCNPMDEETFAFGGHGTHVAGILGAAGNNGVGVAGVNWQTTILPVKWLQTADSFNNTEHLVEALKWLVKAQESGVDVRVVNDSPTFKESAPSPELEHEIKVLGEHQILFVTSAGNGGEDDDTPSVLRYPCKYRLANEICVTASNNKDELPGWANTGSESVDLVAPGVNVYSTLAEDRYGYISGGSMAAAQVSGAAALILSVEPWLSATELKAAILGNVDRLPTLAGKVATSGRLDIAKALPALVGAVSPTSGGPAGGASVTITGANLARATGVVFGSTSAPFTVNSPTSVTATAPPGAGTVDVRVLAPGGLSAPVPGDRFSYYVSASPPIAQLAAPPPASTISLVSSRLGVKRGSAAIRLRCAGVSRCAGVVAITVKVAIRHTGRVIRTRLVAIARTRFSLAAGRTASISVALTASGRRHLRAAHGSLPALLTIPASAALHSSLRFKHVRLLAIRTVRTTL